MAYKEISKPNCTVFVPTFGDQYTTDISVLVFFPGIPVSGKTGKTYFPPLIKSAVPTWFDKYVIVIPNEHTTKWDSVKKEYTEAIASVTQGTGKEAKEPKSVLVEKTTSIGVFSGSGNGNVSIQTKLVSINPTHLIIMDPSASGQLTQNTKTLASKGTACYMMYNPNNWGAYPALKNGFPSLAAAVDAGGNKSEKVSLGHMAIPAQTLKKFAPEIEKKLITPTQKPQDQPVVEDKKTDEQAVADANQTAGKTQSTPVKWNVTINGLGDSPVGAAAVAYEIGAKKDLPNFTIYVGDPETDWARFGETVPPGGDDFDEVLDEEFTEGGFAGEEEGHIEYESMEEGPTPERAAEAASMVEQLENSTPVNAGNWKLDLIPGTFVTNGGVKIQCCQINGSAVNVKIAGAWLDMVAAAKKDGITLSIGSGFRSPYDSINTKSESGVKVSASSQKSLYDAYLAGRGNLAAKPGNSNHGNGIGLDTNAGGKSKGRFINVNKPVYIWLVKNSWRFGFVRAVTNEEWHFDYLPDLAKKGPYGRIAGTDANKFYSEWGLDKLTIA